MMMETIKKTTTVLVLLISCNLMAQTDLPIYGEDIPYPRSSGTWTKDQLIVQEIGRADNQLMPYFYSPIVDADSGCTITAQKNGKPYYSLVFSNCEGVKENFASVPVSGWSNVEIPEEDQRELVTKKQFSKQVYTRLDQENCGNYDQCSQTVTYTLLFTDYRVLYRGNNGGDEPPYRLNVEIKIINDYWNVITDEPLVGSLPQNRNAPSSEQTVRLVLKY